MKHFHFLLSLLLVSAATNFTLAAVLPCSNPEGCPEYWTEERTREHLERCWKMEWCQKLMRQALDEIRQERIAEVGTVVKKDVFTSRGWGAGGGLPSHFTFFNNRKILQQQRDMLKQENQQDPNTKVRQPRFSPLQGLNPGMTLIADSRIFEEDLDENTQPPEPPLAQVSHPKVENTQYHHRNYSSLPQLFVSYGWGPLGK